MSDEKSKLYVEKKWRGCIGDIVTNFGHLNEAKINVDTYRGKEKEFSKRYTEKDRNRVKVASKTFCCKCLHIILIERNFS